MEQTFERRKFLKNLAFTSTGVMFLTSSPILNAFNKGVDAFVDIDNSIYTLDLRENLLNDSSITINGKIFSKENFNDFTNVLLEIWLLNTKDLEANREKIRVNSNGDYRFIIDFPKTKNLKKKIYFKLTLNNKCTISELTITNNGVYINDQHYVNNYMLGDKLFPEVQKHNNMTTINFNSAI